MRESSSAALTAHLVVQHEKWTEARKALLEHGLEFQVDFIIQ